MNIDGKRLNEAERLRLHIDMETEEQRALEAMFKAASDENKRKDAARYNLRACDKTLAEFEALGFQGVQITRNADGEIEYHGIPREVPRYLAEDAA
jgi:hypothetical protein